MEQMKEARNSGVIATTADAPSSSSFIEQVSSKVVIQGSDLRESTEFADNTNTNNSITKTKSHQNDGHNEHERRVSNFFVWGDNSCG